jgi:hypothetical protein
VTGSSSTDRKIHIFALNTNKVLRYFYIGLQANGLPAVANTDAVNRRVDCGGEIEVASTSGGPISAVTYNGNLYVFYSTAVNQTLACSWRPIDSTANWATGTVPKFTYSADPKKGGASAVFVQSTF